MFLRAIFGSTGSYFLFFVSISALCLFVSGINAEERTPSKTEISTPRNSTDSTAEESTVKQRKVRNNVIRYGAIYRGNSSVRANRAFTRRPRLSRKDRHRHSTKVDTTKIPVVLLPPVLTFKNLENEEERKQFLINVASSKQPTVLPDLSTKPFTPAYDSQVTSQSISSQYTSKKPYMDDKIMAMKHFGVRMRGQSRGELKFKGSPLVQSSTPLLTDYTPPPTVFPTEQKSRQVSRSSRRRPKVRTTTTLPTTAEPTTVRLLPRESQYDVRSPSQSQQTPENSGSDRNQAQLNFDNLIYQDSSIPTPINDITNVSLNDVLNYDIQRTSPRTIFSLDATDPVENYGSSTGNQDTHVESNENQVRHDGNFAAISSPSPLDHRSVTISSPGTPGDVGITVSSPGTPTTHVNDFFSNVPQVSSSFVPRTEVNVATSTSQLSDISTPIPNEDDYDFKDLIYPPLDILTPPYLEDEFHDARGNLLPNVTNLQQTNDDSAGLVEQTTDYPDLSKSSFVEFVDNGLSLPADSFNNSVQNPTESYQEFPVVDQSRSAANHQIDTPVVRQPASSQYTDCENGDCQNDTIPQPWSRVPVSPSDIKVLSNEDGIELINRMYENLLRVLNGGPDYYDLSEDPQPSQNFLPEDQFQQQQQLEQQQQFQQQQLEQQQKFQQQQQQEKQQFQQQQQQQFQGQQVQQQEEEKQDNPHDSSSESSLVLAESGDIRNSRGRAQNQIVPSGRRSSKRKDVQKETPETLELKKARAGRKASQLCNSKTLTYVADVSSGCKVFYVCTEFGVGEPMLCPNGTLFNQDYLVCDWWYNVECS